MNLEINILVVLTIIFIHFIADFVLQTHWQASNKSKDWIALLSHTGVYTLCWIPFCFLNFGSNLVLNMSFLFITLISHTVTDYYTSRLNARLYEKGEIHNFFVSVGFDQFLHYAQLLITYQILKNYYGTIE